MRVAITGASGFTGRYVASRLTELGIDWVALSTDLTDARNIADNVAATAFDRLIHLGALAFAGSAVWRPFYEVNQIGTLTLLEAVARYHPGIRCIIASSAQVYGPSASGLVDEDHPTQPLNAYGISKLAMELGAKNWRDELDIVATRPFNYTGVGQQSVYLIPKIVQHFRERSNKIVLGNIDVAREFGDVRSVADAYCQLVTTDCGAQVVNLCTGEAYSISSIIERLEAMTGHSITTIIDPALVRANDTKLLVGDNHRLKSLLPGWRPRALNETLSWMLS